MPVPALMLPDPQGRRIGLFGGSFNPAHNGHAALAREALRRLSLDQVWWMVSPQNPLKDPRDTEDFDERFAAVKAIARHPRMRVLDIEARLDSRTTAETLRRLAAVFRRGRFVWIMGADSFAGLHRWNDWQVIPATLPLAVFARPEFCQAALASPAARILARYRIPEDQCRRLPDLAPPAWGFLRMRLRRESSTAIRHHSGRARLTDPPGPG
jgi:nicotinate-nucleotide adenylyltransferase